MKKLLISMIAAGLLMAGSAIAGPDAGQNTNVKCKDKVTDADIIKQAEDFCKDKPNKEQCIQQKKEELQKKNKAS